MSLPTSLDAFTIERHGEVLTLKTSPILENLDPTLLDGAAPFLLEALDRDPNPQLVVDLSTLDYFGSSFLALLIRCWKLTQAKNGTMALSGVSDRARELLHMTSLDMVWPIYGDVREAIDALQSD